MLKKSRVVVSPKVGPAWFLFFVFNLIGSAAALFGLRYAPGASCIGLLGAPEHELLQPVLFLGFGGRGASCGRGCLRAKLLAGFRLWSERCAHQLGQALDAGSLAALLGYHVRVECAGCAGRVALADVAAATTAEVAVGGVGVSGAEHGRAAAGQRGDIVDGYANIGRLFASGAGRYCAVVVE